MVLLHAPRTLQSFSVVVASIAVNQAVDGPPTAFIQPASAVGVAVEELLELESPPPQATRATAATKNKLIK